MTEEDRDLALLCAARETREAMDRAAKAEAQAEAFRLEARDAREEASRAWAVLTGRDWNDTRPEGSALGAAARVVRELKEAREEARCATLDLGMARGEIALVKAELADAREELARFRGDLGPLPSPERMAEINANLVPSQGRVIEKLKERASDDFRARVLSALWPTSSVARWAADDDDVVARIEGLYSGVNMAAADELTALAREVSDAAKRKERSEFQAKWGWFWKCRTCGANGADPSCACSGPYDRAGYEPPPSVSIAGLVLAHIQVHDDDGDPT